MKTKMLVLLLFATFILTDAVEVTNEDPLVSYLLTRIEQLESKIMVKPNTINTNEIAKKSTEQHAIVSAASNDKCACPPAGVVNYVRWGNSTCPYGAVTVYSGVVAGSWYDHQGAAVDPLCLPHNPQYLKYRSGYNGGAYLYGAEYELGGPLDHSHQRNIPCAVCQANSRTTSLMIPSRYECPPGWTREYYGYLMAGHYGHKAATQHICVDKSLEQITGSGGDTNGKLFYTVEAQCNQFIPCSDKELTCAVCTK
ncbi:uncharacterized protein [Dysidea avara]|uniref:uncharacterized protein n=1 Tax=Dysidea avara TaxID=196820 RepID=UPI0033312E31